MDGATGASVRLPDSSQPILLFDGVCNLCNGFVQTIIKNDKNNIFRFSSLQSGTGQRVVAYINRRQPVPDSLILLYRDKYYTQSDAAIKTAELLGNKWHIMRLGYFFPKAIRNSIYKLVARNRYKWFGKKEHCMVPTEDLQSRFLD